MRIISGSLKGRKFSVPSHFPVRPTTDFAREGLFNVLQHRIDFSALSMLELFTGTGSISLEIWSRGCRDIVAVDKHQGCCSFLNKLSSELELEGFNVVRADAIDFLKRNVQAKDLIFADPPHAYPKYEELLQTVMDMNWLAEDGTLILEYNKYTDLSHSPYFVEEKVYGNVRFGFFQPQELV